MRGGGARGDGSWLDPRLGGAESRQLSSSSPSGKRRDASARIARARKGAATTLPPTSTVFRASLSSTTFATSHSLKSSCLTSAPSTLPSSAPWYVEMQMQLERRLTRANAGLHERYCLHLYVTKGRSSNAKARLEKDGREKPQIYVEKAGFNYK